MTGRVLVCSNLYPPESHGGAELTAWRQAEALHQLGCEVVVFAGGRSSRRKRYEVWQERFGSLDGFRIQLGPEDFWACCSRCFHDPVKEMAFAEILGDTTPSVVHFHNLSGLSAGLIRVAREAGIPTVLTVHDHWALCLHNTLLQTDGSPCISRRHCQRCLDELCGNRETGTVPAQLRNRFVKASYRLLDAIISPSRYLSGAYEKTGIGEGRFHVIPNGVPAEMLRPRARSGRPSGQVEFVYTGYLGPHKGVDTLLEAFGRPEIRSAARLRFVGDGHLRERLEGAVRAAGLGSQVQFDGWVDPLRVPEALRSADCVILPSIWPENHPGSVTEAMAMGVGVIGSRLGGIPELIEDGKTGLLFEPGDTQALAAKMLLMIREPELAALLGREGSRRMAGNTVARRVREIAEVYGQVGA
jgi:glycosyltransferase involved in cell wall biosynthesis